MEDQQLIPDHKVQVPDNPLKEMFVKQALFQERFYDFSTMTEKAKVEYIRLMLTCVNVESVEALGWLNWKPWKKTQVEFNRREFINEIVDIQHFLINVLLVVDCDEKEFCQAFFNKNHENVERQKKGY